VVQPDHSGNEGRVTCRHAPWCARSLYTPKGRPSWLGPCPGSAGFPPGRAPLWCRRASRSPARPWLLNRCSQVRTVPGRRWSRVAMVDTPYPRLAYQTIRARVTRRGAAVGERINRSSVWCSSVVRGRRRMVMRGFSLVSAAAQEASSASTTLPTSIGQAGHSGQAAQHTAHLYPFLRIRSARRAVNRVLISGMVSPRGQTGRHCQDALARPTACSPRAYPPLFPSSVPDVAACVSARYGAGWPLTAAPELPL
jgi:hypothetical protein